MPIMPWSMLSTFLPQSMYWLIGLLENVLYLYSQDECFRGPSHWWLRYIGAIRFSSGSKYKYNLFLYFCKVGYYFALRPVANLQSISTGSMVVIPRIHITWLRPPYNAYAWVILSYVDGDPLEFSFLHPASFFFFFWYQRWSMYLMYSLRLFLEFRVKVGR